MSAGKAKDLHYAVWPTAWGPVGAVADDKGLTRFVLPHYRKDDLKELLAWEHPGAAEAPGQFERLRELTEAYFSANRVDFDEIECDLPSAGAMGGAVARAARKIPFGKTQSYGQLAREIDRPEAARAVAGALSRNRIPLIVPCHRVTYSDGRSGGFSAAGGVELKQRMIDLERRCRDQ